MAVNPYDGAGYGCGLGYGYCGTPASATALDILASVGTFSTKTSSEVSTDGHGLKSYTGFGFEPKAFLPFGMTGTTAFGDGATTRALHSFGAASQISEASIWVDSVSGVTTSDTYRRHSGAKCIDTVGVVGVKSNVNSFDSDGLTLNYTTPYTSALLFNHIALGGADLEVSLTQHQMNATNADESFAHGLSGAPTGVLFFGVMSPSLPPVTSAVLQMTIGAWSSLGQFAASIYSGTLLSTTSTRRLLTNTGCQTFTSTATVRTMAVDSVDNTNVNVTYPVTSSAQQNYVWMLAIRGAKVQTGTFDCNGSTDPLTITTSMTPLLAGLFNVPTGVESINTVQSNAHLGIGWSDGTNNVSCGITDENGRISGTNARRFQDSDDLAQYDVAGTEKFRARVTFSGENAIITPTVCNDGWDQGAYIIIGK